MKKFIVLLILLPFSHIAISQNITEFELNNLAKNLAKSVNQQMKGENLAIADFVDNNDQPSKLGKYLAEEFNYKLVNKSTSFNIIDRTHIRRLMKEAGMGDKGRVDEQSIQKLGRLKGITAVIYGKVFSTGSNISIYVKVVDLETQVNVITVKGVLTSTPTLESFLGKPSANTNSATAVIPSEKITETTHALSTAQFTHKHLQIKLNKCSRVGSYLDCEFQVTSTNRNDNFSVKSDNTKLIDVNGHTYSSHQLIMNGKTSRMQCRQFLRTNAPTLFLVRFANVPSSIQSFSAIDLNCNSSAAYSFTAQLQNIIIQ